MDDETSPFELYEATNLLNQLLACENITPRMSRLSTGGDKGRIDEEGQRRQYEEEETGAVPAPQSPLELFTPRPTARRRGEVGGFDGMGLTLESDILATEKVSMTKLDS